MSRKKISTTIYVTPEQNDKLKLLHERTKVPVAVYIREGIDLVLRHYAHLLPGQLPLGRNEIEPSRPAAPVVRSDRGERNHDYRPPEPRVDHRSESRERERPEKAERLSSSKLEALDTVDDAAQLSPPPGERGARQDEKAAAGSKK